jgi:putative acetyltransferase
MSFEAIRWIPIRSLSIRTLRLPSNKLQIADCVIRRESIEDRDGIRSVTARAFAGLVFSSGTEARIVDALREADALALSLVAVLAEQVVGHVAFSDASPAGDSGWFALGPVSVEPRVQRRGVGRQLIDTGLVALRDAGGKGCVLVGDHRYYSRFGFIVTPGLAPAGYPAQHFQILGFGDAVPTAPPIFHPAFSMAP